MIPVVPRGLEGAAVPTEEAAPNEKGLEVVVGLVTPSPPPVVAPVFSEPNGELVAVAVACGAAVVADKPNPLPNDPLGLAPKVNPPPVVPVEVGFALDAGFDDVVPPPPPRNPNMPDVLPPGVEPNVGAAAVLPPGVEVLPKLNNDPPGVDVGAVVGFTA